MQPVRLKELTKARNTIDRFLGYDHRPVGAAGSWYEAENLSTDFYPLLSVRKNRAQVEDVDGSSFENVIAMCAKEHLVVLDSNGILHCNGHSVDLLEGTLLPYVYRTRGIFTATIDDPTKLETILSAKAQGFYTASYHEDTQKPWYLDATQTHYTLGELGITTNPQGGPFQQGDEIVIRWQKLLNGTGVRSMVSMGANVIIFPDRKWCNTVKLAAGSAMVSGTDYGNLWNKTKTDGLSTFTISMCDINGDQLQSYYSGEYHSIVVSLEQPVTQDGMWLDISQTEPVLKEWSITMNTWIRVPSTYLKIAYTGAGVGFSKGDAVRISASLNDENSGLTENELSQLSNQINGSHYVFAAGENYIVIAGIMAADSATFTVSSSDRIYIEREIPLLDFAVECGNRIWGCRYGVQTDLYPGTEMVNEIYACSLGDPKNWNVFQGLSTDSYTASRGSDGPFTGAAVLDGHPLFFKENCVEKVFPSSTGAHQIQTQTLEGIQNGSGRSAVVIDDKLYYKGVGGVYVYTGTLPKLISGPLGNMKFNRAVAGRHGKKYYINMAEMSLRNTFHTFVFDTVTGIWQREDPIGTALVNPVPWADLSANIDIAMCTWEDVLYYTNDLKIYQVDGGNDSRGVAWHCESGVLGLDVQNHKYISNISLRYKRELGSSVRIYVQYDESGHWLLKETLQGTRLYAGTVSIWPRRCDTFRLKLEGTGGFTVYSLTFDRERGSDLR